MNNWKEHILYLLQTDEQGQDSKLNFDNELSEQKRQLTIT